jgi:hypothetical protein
MLEVLIAIRLSEAGADKQVLDPGAAEVQGEKGMQLVPRPGRAGMPIKVAVHGEEAPEMAEQGDTGKGAVPTLGSEGIDVRVRNRRTVVPSVG